MKPSSKFLYSGLAAITLILVSHPLAAQVTFTDSTSSALTANTCNSGCAIGIADMNGDGKDDIVHLENARDLHIEYQNLPGQTFGHFSYGDVGGASWGMCIGDVDQNGFNDVVTGESYNGVKKLLARHQKTACELNRNCLHRDDDSGQ